jgi:signal transduction histidine kinase
MQKITTLFFTNKLVALKGGNTLLKLDGMVYKVIGRTIFLISVLLFVAVFFKLSLIKSIGLTLFLLLLSKLELVSNVYKSKFSNINFSTHLPINGLNNFGTDGSKSKSLVEQNKEDKILVLESEKEELLKLNNIKNKLFSIIAHDLRTPMYSIKNLFSAMQQKNIPIEELKAMLPDIVHTINHTTSLMENLLLWSKSQMDGFSIKEELIDITEIVQEALQQLSAHANSKNIEVVIPFNKPIHLFADKDMISLVVRNLLNNAIKFTPINGKIELLVIEEPTDIKVYVKDYGLGITKNKLKELFTENCISTNGTASEMGTGLGLVLCKEFIQKNGGEISVESVEGIGSVFSFSLQNNNYCSLYLNK